MNFDILQRADISIGELARMVKVPLPDGTKKAVSRSSAYNWVLRGVQPSPYAAPVVRKVLELITKAVAVGDLPVKLGTPRRERLIKINEALRKQLQS
jgi:hypothetical protein